MFCGRPAGVRHAYNMAGREEDWARAGAVPAAEHLKNPESMNRYSILTKTGKGLMEATGKTSNLSRELRNVLKEIDGQVSVSKLLDRLEKLSEPKLLDILKQLEIEHYVREFVASEEPRPSTGRPSISQPPADADDLDFTSLGSLPPASSRPGPAVPSSRPNPAAPSSRCTGWTRRRARSCSPARPRRGT